MSKHFSPYEAIYPKTAMDLVWLTAGDKLDNIIPPATNEPCDAELIDQFKAKNIFPFLNPKLKQSECRVASYWKSLAAVYPTPEHSLDDIPSLSMLVDIEETWTKVKKAHEMVVLLKALPHNDFYFSGMEHEYDPKTWNDKVLPLVGSVSDYKNTILDAANSLQALAAKHDNPRLGGGWCTAKDGVCDGPSYGVIDISSFPTLVRPAIEALTFMMGEVVNFQGGNGENSRIECEGDECPDENASDDFHTVYPSSVCYMNGPLADEAVCYDSTFNPHLGAIGYMLVGTWSWDTRTGDTEFTNFYNSDGPEGPNNTSYYSRTASSKIIVE